MLRLVLLSALLALSTSARADSPAAIAKTGRDRAAVSFEIFAKEWMEKAQALEEKHRSNPTVKPGATAPIVTYRGYAEDYDVEMRRTGNAKAPYIGLLRYTERVYSCASIQAQECSIVSTIPVTEVFRYREGRWSY
jgi:hypothetical protein